MSRDISERVAIVETKVELIEGSILPKLVEQVEALQESSSGLHGSLRVVVSIVQSVVTPAGLLWLGYLISTK